LITCTRWRIVQDRFKNILPGPLHHLRVARPPKLKTRNLVCQFDSPHFDELFSLVQSLFDPGQECFEPSEKDAIGTIPDAEPHNGRSIRIAEAACHEILIFRNNGPAPRYCEVPDASVIRITQPDLTEGHSGETTLTQLAREGRGQLQIDQQTHAQDAMRTVWSR
jgi:hypothetical protein